MAEQICCRVATRCKCCSQTAQHCTVAERICQEPALRCTVTAGKPAVSCTSHESCSPARMSQAHRRHSVPFAGSCRDPATKALHEEAHILPVSGRNEQHPIGGQMGGVGHGRCWCWCPVDYCAGTHTRTSGGHVVFCSGDCKALLPTPTFPASGFENLWASATGAIDPANGPPRSVPCAAAARS